jgi:hypothetical protein
MIVDAEPAAAGLEVQASDHLGAIGPVPRRRPRRAIGQLVPVGREHERPCRPGPPRENQSAHRRARLAVAGLWAVAPLYWWAGDRKDHVCREGAIMTTFDDRERHEETRFKHQQELAFKARNRGNKMFGLWVAEQLGLSGEEAQSYAKDVVVADFDLPGDEDILTKVRTDLEAKSVEVSDHVLQKRLQELRQVAAEQIKTE